MKCYLLIQDKFFRTYKLQAFIESVIVMALPKGCYPISSQSPTPKSGVGEYEQGIDLIWGNNPGAALTVIFMGANMGI